LTKKTVDAAVVVVNSNFKAADVDFKARGLKR